MSVNFKVRFVVVLFGLHLPIGLDLALADFCPPAPAPSFDDLTAHSVTSCDPSTKPGPLTFESTKWQSLSASDKARLQRIDEVSLATMMGCMQGVFEDGPRRDQRVW